MKQSQAVQEKAEPEWMTPAEVAELMRVNTATVARYRISGKLPSITIGGTLNRFRRSDVLALMGLDEQ